MSFRERYLNRHMLLELAPVAVFFAANRVWDLTVATAALMAATLACVAAGWLTERRVPVFGIVTVVLVLLLGGAGLILDDVTYIQIKPTVAKVLFASALAVGLMFRPSLLERALTGQIYLTARGWRVLTWRWIALALAWACANELARHVLTVDDWVAFKTAAVVVALVLYVAVTRLTAPRYWDEPVGDQPR
jgi:intracellular septation protein